MTNFFFFLNLAKKHLIHKNILQCAVCNEQSVIRKVFPSRCYPSVTVPTKHFHNILWEQYMQPVNACDNLEKIAVKISSKVLS